MAGLTIYIDDKDLKKAQKAGEVTQKYGYTWGSGSSTVEKPKNGTYYVSKTIPHKTQKQIDEEKVPSKIDAVKHDMEVMKELPLPDLEYASQIASRGTPPIFKKDDDGNYVVDYIYDSKKNNAQDVMDAYLKIKDFYDKAKIHNQKAQEYKKNNFGNFLNDVVSLTTFSNWRPFDETQNGIASQLYRWYDRRQQQKQQDENIKNQLSEDGADIIDLSQNVIRLTPTSTQSTGLFNEFVEEKLPSIHRAKDYKEGKIKTFGDQFNIPVENISLYQGIEDGHFKVGNLSDFKDETLIYPVRNVKRNHLAPISKITVSGKNTTDNFGKLNAFDFEYMNSWNNMRDTTGFKESLDEVVKAINDSKYTTRNITTEELLNELSEVSYLPSFNPANLESIPSYLVSELLDGLNKKNKFIDDIVSPSKYNYMYSLLDKDKELNHKMFNILENKKYENIYKTLRADFWNKYKEHFADEEGNSSDTYTVTDTEGNTYPISELNAAILDNKTILGNNNGGIFIGDFKKITKNQLDSVNEYLSKNPSWLVRTDLGSFDTYNLDNPSLKDYLKQYFEHPNENNPNVYVVGTTLPNKLFTPTKQSGGELDKAQKGTQAKVNILDDINEHKFRKLYDSDNKSWYPNFTGRRGQDTNGEVYLANGMSNAEIRKEFPGALIKVENGVKTFRLPKVNEEVVLPKVESKWNRVVTLPESHLVRQEKELLPEKITSSTHIPKYTITEQGIQNYIDFSDPWTLPKWTMAFEDANGKPYSDRYYKLQNEYYDNGGTGDPLEYILNKDFDAHKGKSESNNGSVMWNKTKNKYIVIDKENGVIFQHPYKSIDWEESDDIITYIPKVDVINSTTIDQNAVKRNKFIKEMNDANRIANILNAGQNKTWNLQYQNGGPSEILNQVNRSNSNFVQRLKDPYRQTIKDWVDRHSVATHKLSVGTDENGNYFVYPEVQEINGKLVDFTKRKYDKFDGHINAVKNQDTVRFDNFDDALWFTQNYKNYYPSFDKYQQGGPTGLTIVIDDEQFKKGGQIHIKEKNKGKFTKQAQSAGMSVQEFARHVLAHKDRYPASTVKRANFARNASKWNK